MPVDFLNQLAQETKSIISSTSLPGLRTVTSLIPTGDAHSSLSPLPATNLSPMEAYIFLVEQLDPSIHTLYHKFEPGVLTSQLEEIPDFKLAQQILFFLYNPRKLATQFTFYHNLNEKINNLELKNALEQLINKIIKPIAEHDFNQLIQHPITCDSFSQFIRTMTDLNKQLHLTQHFSLLSTNEDFQITKEISGILTAPSANTEHCHNRIRTVKDKSLQKKLTSLTQTYSRLQTHNNDLVSAETKKLQEEKSIEKKNNDIFQTTLDKMSEDIKRDADRRFHRSVTYLWFLSVTIENQASGITELNEKLSTIPKTTYDDPYQTDQFLNQLIKSLESSLSRNYYWFWPIARVRTTDTQQFYERWHKQLKALKAELPRAGIFATASGKLKDAAEYASNKVSGLFASG